MENKLYVFRLYVMGKGGPSGEKALNDLETTLMETFPDQYDLEVIDLLENPERAVDDSVYATPTVVRRLPDPVKKILGDLSNKEKVLAGLELVGIG